MKNHYFAMKALSSCLFFLILSTANVFSQVGIGTVLPETSSMLDVSSTTKGMLTPRMTTAQRLAITTPADGLMVYDTDLKAFHYYNSSAVLWTIINSASTGRLKFKRIRPTDVLATVLASELAAGGNTKYVLDSKTYYEINGTITFNLPIDLNNAYLAGHDTNEDVIVSSSGNLFEGSTGGSIRNVTLTVPNGFVFNISGASSQNLIFRDSVVANCQNVGTISGLGLVFVSIVQFTGNTTGIIYNNISQLLISNVGWFGNNQGTYEKLTGTFGLVQKQGGFSQVEVGATGFDVSLNPVITGDAIMETVVFTGANTVGYVKPYKPAIYSEYNFNNRWNVRSAGIPTETDLTAVGNINFASATETSATVTPIKLSGTTTSEDLFRFSRGTGAAADQDNRIVYLGSKTRFFKVGGSISFKTSANNTVFIFYIAKNGVFIPKSKVLVKSNSSTDVITTPIQTLTAMKNGDYIELFVATEAGLGTVNILSINLSAN